MTQPEDNIDLEGLEKFAKEFKRRRIELGTAVVISILFSFIYFILLSSSMVLKAPLNPNQPYYRFIHIGR